MVTKDELLEHCMGCDVRTELKRRITWTVFICIVGGITAIAGVVITVTAPMAVTGVTRMMDNTANTATAVHRMEITQEVLKEKIDAHMDDPGE